MDVIFYDFEFNRLKDFPNPISQNIEKCYCGFGSAELHFDICNRELIHLLEDNEYLFFVTTSGSAIVTGWQIGDDIAVYGRTPEWLLTRRGVEAFSVANSTAEEIARKAVESAADFLALGELLNVGEAIDYSTDKVRTMYDVVCEVLKTQNLGFEVLPDMSAKEFLFRVFQGQRSLCVFSPSNRTAYNMTYLVEKQDAVTNSGWYERRFKDMGGWDASSNSPVLSNNQANNAYTFYKITSGEATSRFGLSCTKGAYLYCDNPQGTWKISETRPNTIWLYIDGSEKTGLKKWEAVLRGIKTEEEANAEILQLTKSETVDCEVCRLEYGKDYQLGDIVRVQLEFGDFKKTENKRVASVSIYYDTDKSGVYPKLESMEE